MRRNISRLEAGFQLAAIQGRLAKRAGTPAASEIGPAETYIDWAAPGVCICWAQDKSSPGAPVYLNLYNRDERVGRVRKFWLGDLDSNQGCPGQSQEFYR